MENENALTVLPFSTPVGLNLPPDFSIVAWAGYARAIKVWDCAGHFFLGDLMLYAENKGADFYGEAVQIVDQLDFAPKTLQNCMWIAKRFPPAVRRMGLDYSFYREVASLGNEALPLLDKAIDEKWNVRELGSEARRLKKNLHVETIAPTVAEVKYGQPLTAPLALTLEQVWAEEGTRQNVYEQGFNEGLRKGLQKAIDVLRPYDELPPENFTIADAIKEIEAELAKGALQDAEAEA